MDAKVGLTWCLAAALFAPVVQETAVAPNDARDAVALGRTRDPALYGAFHTGYFLAPAGEVEQAQIITEFRRAVMIVRQHADMGEFSFNENNLAREMKPYRGLIGFVAEIRLHPLHNYPAPPLYEMYVRTGPDSKPLPLEGIKRDPIYPPGFVKNPSFTSFRIEGSAAREAIADASEPALVIVNDKGDIIYQARIDLSRFR